MLNKVERERETEVNITKEMQASSVELELRLPRVVLKGGKVGHLMVEPWYMDHRRAFSLGNMACHYFDFLEHPDRGDSWRFANGDDPTCVECQRQVLAWTQGRLRPLDRLRDQQARSDRGMT